MPTKKNRKYGTQVESHPVYTLRQVGVSGGQAHPRVAVPPHAVHDNIRQGTKPHKESASAKYGAGSGGLFIKGSADDSKTRVSFGGGKRERAKQTQRLSS